MATLSGLASGFDWTSFIDSLMAVSRTPQTRMAAEKADIVAKNSALSSLRNLFADFQNSAVALKSSALFQERTASVAGSSLWSVSAGAGAAVGEHQFAVNQLATAARIQGTSDAGRPILSGAEVPGDVLISSLNLAQRITAGEFTVNGARIAVSETDTLGDVFARISAETGILVAYDHAQDRVSMTSADSSAITLGASNNTSNFLQALKLHGSGTDTVASSGALGVVRTGVAIAHSGLQAAITAVDGAGTGSFSINGVTIGYNVNADSVQNVLDRINASGAGVTAAYDKAHDRFTIVNNSTGDLGIALDDPAGGFLSALGLAGTGAAFTAGRNAEFTVNGGETIVSRSNVLDATVHGLEGLTVTARSTGAQTVSVNGDATSARAAIDAFVAKYNAVQTAIDSMTRVTTNGTTVSTGTLGGNREVVEMGRALRAMLFDAAPGNGGAIKRLADLGIDFSGTGSTLAVKDSAKLDDVLAGRAGDVATYFTDPATGLGRRLDDLLSIQLGSSGSFATQASSFDRQSASLDKQIAAIERRLEAQRASMEAAFIQMETVQSLLQQQADMLTRAFPATKSSNS